MVKQGPRGCDWNGLEPRLWELALDGARDEVAAALRRLAPRVPLTPELRLYLAIFGRRAPEYTAALVEIFMVLHRPSGEWENYRDACLSWVTALLKEAIAEETRLIADTIHGLLETLPERLKRVLWVRFGFDGCGPKTLEQAGREFGLTKERIRQLEAKALRMLRHPSRSRYLKEFVPGEWLRARVLAECRSQRAMPAIFLLWEEDREALLPVKKTVGPSLRTSREVRL